jgi:nucleoside-diphosphate-sugar epimerase
MNVFLTGGTGYLGNHVARVLLEAGHRLDVLVRTPARAGDLAERGAALVAGDLLEPASWSHRLNDAEAVVHVAGMVQSWSRPREQFDRVNVQGTLDLVDLALEAGVGRILVAGSFFVLGPSPPDRPRDESSIARPAHPLLAATDYTRTKSAVTRRLWQRQQAGDPILVVLPTILVGPGKRTEGNYLAGVLEDVGRRRLPGLIGDGNQVWNLVPVTSAARGFRLALESGRTGESYILGGEHWTQHRIVERGAELFGVPAPARRLGTRLPLLIGGVAELWAAVTRRPPLLTRGAVRMYDVNWVTSSAKAERELGYRADSVDDALRDTVRALQRERGT